MEAHPDAHDATADRIGAGEPGADDEPGGSDIPAMGTPSGGGRAPVPGVDREVDHVLGDLGFAVWRDGEHLCGSAEITPGMHVPGTSVLRMSILATWTDMLAGLLSAGVVQPRVPVTLQLDVNLARPPVDLRQVTATARMVKAGGEVVVSDVDLFDEAGEEFGIGTGLFMVARDPALRMPADLDELIERMDGLRGTLTEPFADRAGCERTGPGTASIGVADGRTNAAGTLNGGLIALAVEEAVLAGGPPGSTLSSMSLRYLRPVRVGPADAVATSLGDISEVTVVDRGRDAVLSTMATTRRFPSA